MVATRHAPACWLSEDAVAARGHVLEANISCLLGRAAALSNLDRFEEAVSDCKKAIELDPKYSKAYGRLGYVTAHATRTGRSASNGSPVAVGLVCVVALAIRETVGADYAVVHLGRRARTVYGKFVVGEPGQSSCTPYARADSAIY